MSEPQTAVAPSGSNQEPGGHRPLALEIVQGPRTVAELVQRRDLVQQILKGLMKDGVHFGKVPGAQKPSLWKPGAEVLLSAFRVNVRPEQIEIESLEGGHRGYRVTVSATDSSGAFLGAAAGECSTAETKYAWRTAASVDEFNAAPESDRRVKFGGSRRTYEVAKQVRTNPADYYNTCLKMAVKRAEVALALQIFAASDVFTQDIGDPEDAYEPPANPWDEDDKKPPQPPRKTPAAPAAAPAAAPEPSVADEPPPTGTIGIGTISREQQKKLFATANALGWKPDELKGWLAAKYGVDSSSKIQRGDFPGLLMRLAEEKLPSRVKAKTEV